MFNVKFPPDTRSVNGPPPINKSLTLPPATHCSKFNALLLDPGTRNVTNRYTGY